MEDEPVPIDKVSPITIEVIRRYITPDIKAVLEHGDSFTDIYVNKHRIRKVVNELTSKHYITIKGRTDVCKELFILYEFCCGLLYLNKTDYNIGSRTFRTKILFPHVIFVMFRHLDHAKRFILDKVEHSYAYNYSKHYGMVRKYISSYFYDENVVKNDTLYSFIGNGLLVENPLDVKDLNVYYKSIFKHIFYYYFKSKHNKYETAFYSISQMETFILNNSKHMPARVRAYRDVLYSCQVQKYCRDSPILSQINYNYNIFKNIIINNELQSLYLTSEFDLFLTDDNQFKINQIYSRDIAISDVKLQKIKELPLIYKLLKSVRVVSSSPKRVTPIAVTSIVVKDAILLEITSLFKNVFSDGHLYSILDKTAENFVTNLLSGEYINLLTLTTIHIESLTFIPQLRQFIKICIEDLDHTQWRCE